MDMELDPRRSIMNHAQSGYPYPEHEAPKRWQDSANCADVDPEIFYPTRGETDKERMARIICGGCAVQAECLNFALINNIKNGWWGGKSERQRRIIRRDLRIVR